jgi:hypothetical protein
MIKELDDIILTCDLPQHGLTKDDIGTVVLVHNNGVSGAREEPKAAAVAPRESIYGIGIHCRRLF